MTGLDRVRPRTPEPTSGTSATELRDQDGKRALFSLTPDTKAKAFGSVTIDCAACGEQSVLAPIQAIRATIPSLHLPFFRREHPSYLKCPACGKFSWARLSVQL